MPSAATMHGVRRAQAFLEGFQQSATVEDVARYANLSPFHLCRAFRAQSGRTMHAYRTALRLHHGFDALAAAGSLSDLAVSLGFASHSHFSAQFKRHFGFTPRSVSSLRLLAAS